MHVMIFKCRLLPHGLTPEFEDIHRISLRAPEDTDIVDRVEIRSGVIVESLGFGISARLCVPDSLWWGTDGRIDLRSPGVVPGEEVRFILVNELSHSYYVRKGDIIAHIDTYLVPSGRVVTLIEE